MTPQLPPDHPLSWGQADPRGVRGTPPTPRAGETRERGAGITKAPHAIPGQKVAESTLMDSGENFPASRRFASRKIIVEVSQHDRGINCVILKVYGMHKGN